MNLSKMSQYNLRNPAVKRLMKEAEELFQPTDEYHAQPLEDNLFEWHFTLRGPPNSDFDGGIYHGRITLPPDYPMKPPSIILLTPNGRFETNKKICLSISGYHPESWQPSWSIRTALLAIIGFMPTHGNGALGSLDYTPEERKLLALKSQEFKCPECGYIKDIFLRKNSTKSVKDKAPESSPLKTLNTNNVTPVKSSEKTCSKNTAEDYNFTKSISGDLDGNLVVHRHKTSENALMMSDRTSHVHVEKIAKKLEKSVENQQINKTSQNQQNLLYLVLIFFIIFTLLFLIFRRILSM